MNANCLVTKLKGSVNNPELRTFGGFKFSVAYEGHDGETNLNQNRLYFNTAIDKIVVISGSNLKFHAGSSWYNPEDCTGISIDYVTGTGVFEVVSKYKLTRFEKRGNAILLQDSLLQNIDVMPDLKDVQIVGTFTENTSILDATNINNELTSFIAERTGIAGDFGVLCDKFPGLYYFYINNTQLTGDFKKIGKLTNILNLDVSGLTFTSPAEDNTFEKLVQLQVSNGRATGSVNFQNAQTNLKFNGAAITANSTLTWAPSSQTGKTDVTYNSVTVTVDNL